jgi:lysophospholipase L1-like esterase
MQSFSTRRSFVLASVIVLSILVLMEAVLRVVGVAAPVRPRLILRLMDTDITLPFMRADPDVFWSPLPGYRGEFMGKAVRVSSLGLRGPEIARPRPADRRRLACFGDSITFGYGVSDEETYPHALGVELASRGVEVINAGVTGFTSHQVLAFLKRMAPLVQPDVTTFCVGWNDGNRRPVDDREYERRLRMVSRLDGTLDHIYLFRGMKAAYLRAAAVKGIDPAQGAPRDDYRVSLPQYRQNLEAIVSVCRQRGIQPVFVGLPRRRMTGEPPVQAPYAAVLVETGKALGVPVLDSGDLGLGTTLPDNQAYFIDTLHLNPEGNRLLARLLARQLVEKGLL